MGEGYRFCGSRGAAVGGCPSCGEPLTPGERFCHACGHQAGQPATMSGTAVPSAGAAPDGEPVAERRVVSVLFCDMVGFTPLSEVRDPEAVRELSSRYFDVAFTAALTRVRKYSTPYHLAHGLLDYAEYLISHGETAAAGASVEEARAIGQRLRCQSLLDRADAVERAEPRISV